MSFEINFPLKRPGLEKDIDQWWQVFKDHEEQIDGEFSVDSTGEIDIAEFMAEHLDKIHPEMSWEFGPGTTKPHVLAIAPERRRDLDPLARMIVDRIPDDLKYFSVHVNRSHTDWEQYSGMQDGRLSWKSPIGIHFTSEIGEFSLIDLVFYTNSEHQDERTFDNCFIMMESLLGEEVVRDWIGAVDIEETKSKGLFGRGKAKIPKGAQPVSNLRQAVASDIAKIKNLAPKQPYSKFSETGGRSLLQMTPREGDDFPRMDDLITFNVLSDGPSGVIYIGQNRFSSERFSAHGEIFVFLKLDGGAEDLDMEIFEDRAGIEDALADVLEGPGLGGVIGGGTGVRYSYIFLALKDFDKAIEAIREVLQNGRMTRRSWILFNDTYREQEWIGVWDDTPAPLLPSID